MRPSAVFNATGAKIAATELLDSWSARMDEIARNGGKAAYGFVMGNCAELLAAFDIPLFLPEISCLRTAIVGTARDLLERAEESGYSTDICNYLKADAGMRLGGGKGPPAPCLAIASTACNTYVKWAEIWKRLYGMPLFVFDLPGRRAPGTPPTPGDPEYRRDLEYVTAQTRALIGLCEELTGQSLDERRLGHALDCTNRMNRDFRLMLEMNMTDPACFDTLRLGGAYLGVYNLYRGTEAGARFFSHALDELRRLRERRVREPLDYGPYRLLFVGVPCYPLHSEFIRMFSGHGGIFVASTYLRFASGGVTAGFQYDPERPVGSLAEGLLTGAREAMDSMFLPADRLPEAVEAFQADGVVFHAVKSCRTVSTGLAAARIALISRTSIPTLLLESDMMDRRLVSPAQMRNRIDAFFETLRLARRGGGA